MNKYRLQVWVLLIIVVLGVVSVFAQDGICSDVPEPRLVTGMDGEVTPGSANNVRIEPTTSAEVVFRMEAGSRFTVLDGPRCQDSYNWWRISKDGQEGWTVEGNNDGYFLEPIAAGDVATPTATTPASSGDCVLAPRLVVGQQGNLTSNIPSRLRDAAGTAGQQIGQLEPLDTFTLLEGPVCLDGINWWRVEAGDVEGWTAEGADGEYFLESVPIVPTSTPAFLPLPASYALDWSSDGAYIAVGTAEGVFIFDAHNWQTPPVQFLTEYGVTSVAFNPAAPNLLAVNPEGIEEIGVRIIDVETGENAQFLFKLELFPDVSQGLRIQELTFTNDGTKLGMNSNYRLSVLELESGSSIYDIRPRDYGNGDIQFVGFTTTAISPNGEWMAGEYPSEPTNFVFAFTIGTTETELLPIEGLTIQDTVTTIAYSRESDRFVIGAANGNLRMWTVPDFEYTSFIRGERSTTSNRINDVAFSPTEPILVTAESDPLAVVRVFDAYTLEQLEATVLEDTVGGARALVFSPDGTQLAVLVDDTVLILDTTTFETVERLVLQQN
jgi:WD40 repeat protein